jgi:tRNA 2-selenouridine synthase
VHPHQLEIQDFAFYALVIDARSRAEYDEDHLPGAVHLPAANEAPWQPPGPGSEPSAVLQLREPEPAVPYALAALLPRLEPFDPVLVYCSRGGLDASVWAQPLRRLGYRVDVLGGGWGNYRRWLDAGLEVLPRLLPFKRLVAPPAGGLDRVLAALREQRQQVLDLITLAGQCTVPGLSLPGDPTPSQAAFDSAVLDALRRFEADQVVWVPDVALGALKLPPALRDILALVDSVGVEVPQAERARAWFDDLGRQGLEVDAVVARLERLTPAPSLALQRRWDELVRQGRPLDALAAILHEHVDVQFSPGQMGSREVLAIKSLDDPALTDALLPWLTAIDTRASGQINP